MYPVFRNTQFITTLYMCLFRFTLQQLFFDNSEIMQHIHLFALQNSSVTPSRYTEDIY